MTLAPIGLNLPTGAAPQAGRPAGKESPARIEEAASQFEALLLAQMLRQIREAGGDSGEESGNHLMGFAEEQLAQVLSARGGLGIARMASASLLPATAADESGAAPAPAQPAKLQDE